MTTQTDRKAMSTEILTLVVNGEELNATKGTLNTLLDELGYQTLSVATAVNGEFVAKNKREKMTLNSGDRIEIVSARQGG